MAVLRVQGDSGIDRDGLSKGLRQLGYDVDMDEVDALMRQLDVAKSGRLHSEEIAASILDWHALQVIKILSQISGGR